MPISYSSELSQSGICGRHRPQQWTEGGSPYLLSPIPLHFSLPPYPLPSPTGLPYPFRRLLRFVRKAVLGLSLIHGFVTQYLICVTISQTRRKDWALKRFQNVGWVEAKTLNKRKRFFANISAWIREQERTWRLLNRVQIRPGSQKWQRLVNFLILTRRKTGRFLFQRSRERFCARGFDLRTNFLLFYFTDYLILL